MTEFRHEDEVSVRGTILSIEGRAIHVIVGESVVVVPFDDVKLVTRSFHEGDRVQIAGLPVKYDVNTGTILKRLEDGVFLVKIDHTFGAESYTITAKARLTHLVDENVAANPSVEAAPAVAPAILAPVERVEAPLEVAQAGAPYFAADDAEEAEDDDSVSLSEETVNAVSRPFASLTNVVTSMRRGQSSFDDEAAAAAVSRVPEKAVIDLSKSDGEQVDRALHAAAEHSAEVSSKSAPPLAENVDTAGLANALGQVMGEANEGGALGFDVADSALS